MMSHAVRRSFTLSLAAIMGLIPFAGDMYLSSLPAIGQEFATPAWVTQLTLTGFLLLLGIGQLVAGPVTDAVGRRRPLLFGLLVFTLGSLVAVLAWSMPLLIVARVLQGIGGAMAVVVANSSVRDRATGDAATRLYATLLTVTALAPVIAPAAGGFIEQHLEWRAVFMTLTVMGALVTLCAAVWLPESLPAANRRPLAFGQALSSYGRLLRSRSFVVPLTAMSVMFMLLFAYIGGASYIYQEHYALNAATFGAAFGVTGVALLFGATTAGRLSPRWDARRVAILGVTVTLLGSALAVAAAAAGWPLWFVVTGMALNLFGLGTCEPVFMSMCMSAVDSGTGSAAALTGAAQYILGGLAGVVATGGPLGWTVLLLVFAPVALVLAWGCTGTPTRNPSEPLAEAQPLH
jgi:DHA1 family bicyclomycin/chloramphenicol resistance-like MFS transporter